MSRNIWVGVVVVAVLVAGGWWYLNQSSAPATSEVAQSPTLQETENTGALTRESVKVGDNVGGLVVTDIKVIALPSGDPKKDLRINFSGETTITGTYAIGGVSGPDEVSIIVNKVENPQFASFLLDADAQKVAIVLSNSATARKALAADSGKVSMRIKDLSAAWASGTAAVTTAEFVVLIQ